MRCSRKSTTWALSALLAAACGIAPAAAPAPQAGPADDAAARDAIVEAVRVRVGEAAEVRLAQVLVKAPRGATRLVATPEPGARLGRPARFSLSTTRGDAAPGISWAAGYAVATVSVLTDCVRAARPVAAGARLEADDLRTERADPGAVPLQRLPAAAEVIGARARTRLETGDLVTAAAIAARELVRSGDPVTIRVSADGVEAEAPGIATQSGAAGDTIRVVNSTSRRPLAARIVGPGTVEVIR